MEVGYHVLPVPLSPPLVAPSFAHSVKFLVAKLYAILQFFFLFLLLPALLTCVVVASHIGLSDFQSQVHRAGVFLA